MISTKGQMLPILTFYFFCFVTGLKFLFLFFFHFIILTLLSKFFYIYRKVPDILGTYLWANIEITEMSAIKKLYLGLRWLRPMYMNHAPFYSLGKFNSLHCHFLQDSMCKVTKRKSNAVINLFKTVCFSQGDPDSCWEGSWVRAHTLPGLAREAEVRGFHTWPWASATWGTRAGPWPLPQVPKHTGRHLVI